MNKPTQAELEQARDTMEWYIAYLERNEEGAFSTINAGNDFLMGWPDEEDLIDE